MPFSIVRQDITKMQVDAIVNSANTGLQIGGGVCGAIFRAAGVRGLQKNCNKASPIQAGPAAITQGFALPAQYMAHAAGPLYSIWKKGQCRALPGSANIEPLKLAEKTGSAYHRAGAGWPRLLLLCGMRPRRLPAGPPSFGAIAYMGFVGWLLSGISGKGGDGKCNM